jgi:hypothetical protein
VSVDAEAAVDEIDDRNPNRCGAVVTVAYRIDDRGRVVDESLSPLELERMTFGTRTSIRTARDARPFARTLDCGTRCAYAPTLARTTSISVESVRTRNAAAARSSSSATRASPTAPAGR